MADDDDNDTPSPSTDLPIESWSEFNAKLRDAAGVDNSPLTQEEAAYPATAPAGSSDA